MIKHLPKIIGLNNSFNIPQKEYIITRPTSNLTKVWSDKKRFISNLPLAFLFFISSLIGIQDAYAQCTPPIAGSDGTSFVCRGEIDTIFLFVGLRDTAMNGGYWSTASGVTPIGSLGKLGEAQIADLPLGDTEFEYTVPGMPACPDSTATVTLTVTANPTITGINTMPNVCDGNPAVVTVNGLADKNYLISYAINGNSEMDVPLTSSGGMGTFNTRILTTADDGMTLTVVGVTDTTITPFCDTSNLLITGTLSVGAQPEIQGRDTTLCYQTNFDLSLLLDTITSGGITEYGDAFGNYGRPDSLVPSLTVGTTTYFVRDSNATTGCFDTTTITLTVFDSPNIVGRDSAVCNTGNFDLRLLLTGDSVSTLEYGLGTFGTYNLPNGIVNPGAPSTYTYFVRDSILVGCVDTAEINLTITSQPEITGRDTILCDGDSINLNNLITRTIAGDSVVFRTMLGTYGTLADSIVMPGVGVHTYFARDSIGGPDMCSDTAQIIITVYAQPDILGRDTTICSGESVDLVNLVTRFTAGDTLEFGTTFGAFGGMNVTPLMTMTDTFFVRDSIGDWVCVDTSRIIVNVVQTPELVGSDITICDGETVDLNTILTRTLTGDSLAFGTVFGVYGPQADSLVMPTDTITYFIRDSMEMWGCADTAMITVNVSPQPAIQGRDTTICSGETVDLSLLVSQTVAGDSLEYGTAFGVYGTMSNLVTNLTMTDTFYIRDSIGAYICSDTTRIIITVIPTPELVGSDITICNGEMVDLNTLLTRTVTGDSLAFGTVFGVYGPQADSIVMPTDTITYFVRDSVEMWGCADTAMVTVNVSPQPTIAGRDSSVCKDQLVDLKTLVNTNGSLDSLEFGATFGNYSIGNMVNPSVTTTYYLRDSNKVSGCLDTAQIVINIFNIPMAGGITGDNQICVGDMDTLAISPMGGTGIFADTIWLSDNPAAASVMDGIVSGLSADIARIKYVIEDSNGCQDTSSNHFVIVHPLPLAGDITGDTALCLGTTTTLTADPSDGTGTYNITWFSTFDTVATVNAAGVVTAVNPGLTDIYYTVTDAESCGAVSNFFDVRVDTFPSIIFGVSDPDSTICDGDAVIFTANGGVMYEFLLNATSIGAANPTNTYNTDSLNNGDQVRVVVTNMNGCVDTSATIIMVVDTIPIATLVSDDADNMVGTGQNVIFTAGGGSSFEFFVNNISLQGPAGFDTFAIDTIAHLDTILVRVTDGNSCIDTTSLVMIVNTPPTALNDTIQIAEDTPEILIAVQDNDTDPEGDVLTTIIITDSANGLDNTLSNDTIRYIPNLDFNGFDTIVYQVCDVFANCDTATVFITVTPLNDAPVTEEDTIYILEDAAISIVDVLINDIDPDGEGDTLIVSNPNSLGLGTALVVMDTSISFVPFPDSNGMDFVVYQVCDTSNLCDVGILRIFITPVNDAPVAVKDSITVNEDSVNVQVAILANDFDVDRDIINIDSVYSPSSGGTVMLNNDTIIYNPPANFSGLDSIQYAICDTAICDTTYLIINVLPVNEAPVAVKDSVTIPEDTTYVKIALLANDYDVDGDIIVIDSLFAGTQGPIGILSNDTLCYSPPANFNGIDSIKYIITDGTFKDSTYIIINVLSINDAPIAVNDTVTIPENANPAIIAVQANDSDPDGNLFATAIITGPSNGSAVEAGGNVNYIPTMSFNGMDTITYSICDTEIPSQCDTATIFITVSGINDAPVAQNDTICIVEDTTAVLIAVEMNDSDIDGDPLTVSIMTGAMHSSIDSVRSDTLVYQPVLNFNGLDSVQYQVSDGLLVDDAWVYIKIEPRNDAPVAVTDSTMVPEDTMNVTIAVTINDSDVDTGDSLITSIVSGPTSTGVVSIVNDTAIVYTPPANFNGIDTIVYQVCDTSAVCDIATLIVRVTSVADKPIAFDDAYTVPEDTTNVVIDVQLNDIDGDGDLLTTRIISTFMVADTLTGGAIRFSPDPDSVNVQLIAYEICDPTGLCDTGVVTITVTPVNDAPIAVTDAISINQDTTNVGIAAVANDIDIDDNNLTITTISNPTSANGTASILGLDSILYTPLAGFSGLDTIQYTVCDTSNACDVGMVLITVGFVNTPPIAVDDNLTGIAEDAMNVAINVVLNDSDINGAADSLKVTLVTTPVSGGTATISGDSTILYTPPADFNGMDSVQYTVCDTAAGCATAWVFFTVDAVNDKPIANRDTVYVSRDTANALLLVKMNDTDVDGDVLTVMTIGNSTQGVMPSVVNDSILYSAPVGYVGTDEITYKVTDTGGLMDTTTVIIVITDPNNEPPVANADIATTTPANTIIIDVQANDVEPNGDSLITTIIGGPNVSNTAVVLNNDSIQYTPAINFAGPDTIIYQVCDPSLTCDTDTLFILVENKLIVSARVILEGPYDPATTWMHDSLRTLGFIPTTEPYSTYPSLSGSYQFVHKGGGGNETINPAILNITGGDAIVDWVYLELLSAADTIPVASRSALLQRDGDIVDVDGVSPVGFDLLPNGNYFLSVRHRNHLGVMTDTAYAFMAGAFSKIDFSEEQSLGGAAIFGEYAVDTISSRLVLWAGDGNADRKIIYAGIANDRTPVFFDVINENLNIGANYNHVSFGYHQGDFDMKGSSIYLGSGNDPDVIFFNIFLHPKNNLPGNTPTVIHIIREQIPR